MSKTPQVDALSAKWRNDPSIGPAFLQMRELAGRFEYRLSLLEDGLRDQFAMAALQGMLSNDALFEREATGELYGNVKHRIAAMAYSQADAMLKAREVFDHD